MKRILFSLGCCLSAGAIAAGQERVPSASLGRPSASLGRPVSADTMLSPDVRPAGAIDFVPKNMPKGTISESPTTPMLPMPMPMPAGTIPGPTPTPMPGGIVTPAGPVLNMPGGIASPIVPGGPVMSGPIVGQPSIVSGPIVSQPMAGCDSPYGCGIPGLVGMPIQPNNWYASAEYLVWFTKGYNTPALATVGPVASQGILGQAGVSSIFPNGALSNNPYMGGRFGLGYWFSPKWAIETNFFFLHSADKTFSASSGQYPNMILGRPFFSLNQGTEFVEQIGNPGIYAGNINITQKSSLLGLDLNLRKHWIQSCNYNLDLLAGFRFVDLGEELIITENAQGLAGAPAQFVGQNRVLTDSFKTKNQFYGGQIGAAFDYRWGRWNLNAQTKLALGGSVMTSSISGGIAPGGGPTPNLPGGLLALNSNSSSVTSTKLAFIPEVNLNLGYDLTQHTRIFVGYSFMYWTAVARPGAQIDRNLDENRIPDFTTGRTVPTITDTRPLNVVQREPFWAQGVNFGIQFRW